MVDEVFVFGSNLAGRHGRGAALHARRHYGAVYGQGEGLQGRSYAVPTKDHRLRSLPLSDIESRVRRFVSFASSRPDLVFNVTRVGCGLAGYRDDQVGPMFRLSPPNCRLPAEWVRFVVPAHGEERL